MKSKILPLLIASLTVTFISYSQQITPEKINWLRKRIYPIKSINNSDDIGLNQFFNAIKNAKIIGLGEASHGSHENFETKNKLVKFLAEKDSSFNIYSLESNMAKAKKINDFIHKKNAPTSNSVLKNTWSIYQTQEFMELLLWMQKHENMNFYGFDMQYFQQSIVELKNELKDDNSLLLINKIDTILTTTFKLRYKLKKNTPLKAKHKKTALKNIKMLEKTITNITALQKKKWLLQNCTLLKQFINQTSSNDRDNFMAENVLWIHKQHPTSKILVSAHNLHVEKRLFKQGNIIHQKISENYISVGFLIYEGSISAKKGKLQEMKHSLLDNAPSDSYEFILNQLNEPLFFIDLRNIKKENSSNSKWFLKKRKHREVGSIIYPNSFKTVSLSNMFDIIVFIKKSSPSLFINLN